MELQKTTLTAAEIEHLREGLKRTHKERFLFATNLYRTHTAAIKKATMTHKPFLSKYSFGRLA